MITEDYINDLIDVTVSDQSLTSEEAVAMIKTFVSLAVPLPPVQSSEDELERECEKAKNERHEM